MATEANGPGTTASTARGGGVAWSAHINVKVDDGTGANCYGDNDPTLSDWLDVTNFGFTAVSGTVDGVTVTLKRKAENSGYIGDERVQLIKGGTASGDNKATATNWTTSWVSEAHGGAADLWSLTLADTDITASTFGVRVAADVEFDYTAYIDYISIEVQYTSGGGPSTGPIGGLTGGGLVDSGLVDSGLVG